MSEILSDMKVLDLTRVAAGPWCTQLLADMGATVYKIERPRVGDDARGFRPFVPDGSDANRNSAFFMALNRGKHSITIDLATPEGADIIRALAARCDMFVENYKVGDLKRFGLDYESIRAVNPSIVYCSVTGFGQTGPYAARPAYDSIMQASAGLMSLCGDPDGAPQRTAIAVADLTTGYCACVAILGAMIHKMRTGEGQYIDTAMLDATVALTAQYASAYLLTGEVPKRAGNRAPNTFPSGLFNGADGQLIVVCANDRQFLSLSRLIGREELASDPRFHTNIARRDHHAELTEIINSVLGERPVAEWIERFEEVGVPAGGVNAINDVFADPQVIHRGLQIAIEREDGPPLPAVRSPLNFSSTPVRHRPAPSLGASTRAVLRDELGRTDDELASLAAAGVI